MKIALYAAAATLLTAGAAMAQGDAPDQNAKAYVDAAFSQMDADGNGSISKTEFQNFTLTRLARQKAAFDEAFGKADANNDGKISKAESAAANPQLAANFDRIDGNGDGFVTAEEIRDAVRRAQTERTAAN